MRFLQQIISKLGTVFPRPAKPCCSQHKWGQWRTKVTAEEGVGVETDNGFSEFWIPVPFQKEMLCYFINCFEVNITTQKNNQYREIRTYSKSSWYKGFYHIFHFYQVTNSSWIQWLAIWLHVPPKDSAETRESCCQTSSQDNQQKECPMQIRIYLTLGNIKST